MTTATKLLQYRASTITKCSKTRCTIGVKWNVNSTARGTVCIHLTLITWDGFAHPVCLQGAKVHVLLWHIYLLFSLIFLISITNKGELEQKKRYWSQRHRTVRSNPGTTRTMPSVYAAAVHTVRVSFDADSTALEVGAYIDTHRSVKMFWLVQWL